jgi:NDP-sugar pyrophosphorylase family protein
MPSRDRASQRLALRQRNDWPTRAVILAAGRGKRLIPHTDRRPKPLLEIDGQPMLGAILQAVNEAAVRDVCIVTHHLAEQIVAFAGDGQKWNLQTEYRRQESLLGTADGLRVASSFLSEPTLVLAADYLLPADYLLTLKAAYQESSADLFASLKELTPEEIARRSGVRFDDQGRIVEILEKPARDAIPSAIGASLIYVLPPDVASYLPRIGMSERGEYELTDVLNAMLADGYEMEGLLQPPPFEWPQE